MAAQLLIPLILLLEVQLAQALLAPCLLAVLVQAVLQRKLMQWARAAMLASTLQCHVPCARWIQT